MLLLAPDLYLYQLQVSDLISFSVSFNPTLRYFLDIFLLLNFHKDTILPQACIS